MQVVPFCIECFEVPSEALVSGETLAEAVTLLLGGDVAPETGSLSERFSPHHRVITTRPIQVVAPFGRFKGPPKARAPAIAHAVLSSSANPSSLLENYDFTRPRVTPRPVQVVAPLVRTPAIAHAVLSSSGRPSSLSENHESTHHGLTTPDSDEARARARLQLLECRDRLLDQIQTVLSQMKSLVANESLVRDVLDAQISNHRFEIWSIVQGIQRFLEKNDAERWIDAFNQKKGEDELRKYESNISQQLKGEMPVLYITSEPRLRMISIELVGTNVYEQSQTLLKVMAAIRELSRGILKLQILFQRSARLKQLLSSPSTGY